MGLHLYKDKGQPLEKQKFTWKEMAGLPYSKLDVDAFTRIRVILMNGIESEALRFSHVFSRAHGQLREQLARIRRVEQHQQTMVNWLNPADQSPLETTIGYEQVAIEVTAALAQLEPDPYLKEVYNFGLLEDFDHMYRYSALMDRVEGKDANSILQSYTDILPGRPTAEEHRDPGDDIRKNYDKSSAKPMSKLNAITIVAGEFQTHDYYMTIGPTFTDPLARALYAEIASIEEQHVTQYESMMDPNETWLERWVLHEANEAFNYYSCVEAETDQRIRAIWERFLDYELGHLQVAMEAFKQIENRDPAEILPEIISEPIPYQSQREYVRRVLKQQVNLRADGDSFVDRKDEPLRSQQYRKQLSLDGVPSVIVAEDYDWQPGTELSGQTDRLLEKLA